MDKIICSNCKGNGYIRLRFEAEESIYQCEVCHSQGEVEEEKKKNNKSLLQGKIRRVIAPVVIFEGEPPF